MDGTTKRLVRQRAGDRCEYCLLPQAAQPYVTFHGVNGYPPTFVTLTLSRGSCPRGLRRSRKSVFWIKEDSRQPRGCNSNSNYMFYTHFETMDFDTMTVLRFRFTIRLMMIAVAIAGLALGTLTALIARRSRFQELAAYHQRESWRLMPLPSSGPRYRSGAEQWRAEAPIRLRARQSQWNREMEFKYTKAALYPWLPVDPDLREPK